MSGYFMGLWAGFCIGFAIGPVIRRLYIKLNNKFDEWANV